MEVQNLSIKPTFSICIHGNRKYHCKTCNDPRFCEHGRQKYHCKDCGGNGFCTHGRQRNFCVDCGGSGICTHGRRKSTCRQCVSANTFSHGRRKSTRKQHCKSEHQKHNISSMIPNNISKDIIQIVANETSLTIEAANTLIDFSLGAHVHT